MTSNSTHRYMPKIAYQLTEVKLELSNDTYREQNDQMPRSDPSTIRMHVPTDGDKMIENNQRGNIVLMFRRILRAYCERTVW